MACAQIAGYCLAFSALDVSISTLCQIPARFRNAVHDIPNDTASKKIARVAAETLRIVGGLFLASALLSIGLGVLRLGPEIGLLAAFAPSIEAAAPHIASAVGSFAVAALTFIYGGQPYSPPQPAPAPNPA